jgi:glycerol kinase
LKVDGGVTNSDLAMQIQANVSHHLHPVRSKLTIRLEVSKLPDRRCESLQH